MLLEPRGIGTSAIFAELIKNLGQKNVRSASADGLVELSEEATLTVISVAHGTLVNHADSEIVNPAVNKSSAQAISESQFEGLKTLVSLAKRGESVE
jgi:hypothetical protein